MHVKLKVLRGASAGKEVVVRGPRFFIGRSEECHLRANSDAISRRHCAITVHEEGARIRDLGSRNGTYVNGVRIDGDHQIQMGDQLRVGPLEFLVTYLKPAAHAATPATPARSTGSEDMDGLIGDWLSEGDELEQRERRLGAGETREFRMDETSRINMLAGEVETLDEVKPAPAEGDKAEKPPSAPDDKAQQRAGIGPPRRPSAKAPPKDTQEAAAQTLRKFFNRGG